mmetsp:Transcript_28536/g.69582  ORF Transcript_28536/g.69582 Transcript_28536/m.69582 type:complete len:240 (-) Transcript_28536:70-789(-)
MLKVGRIEICSLLKKLGHSLAGDEIALRNLFLKFFSIMPTTGLVELLCNFVEPNAVEVHKVVEHIEGTIEVHTSYVHTSEVTSVFVLVGRLVVIGMPCLSLRSHCFETFFQFLFHDTIVLLYLFSFSMKLLKKPGFCTLPRLDFLLLGFIEATIGSERNLFVPLFIKQFCQEVLQSLVIQVVFPPRLVQSLVKMLSKLHRSFVSNPSDALHLPGQFSGVLQQNCLHVLRLTTRVCTFSH